MEAGEPPSSRQPARGRGRLIAARLVLAVAAVLVGLVLGEAGLRLYARVRGLERGDLAAMLERSSRATLGEGEDRFSLRGLVQSSPVDEIVYELKPGLRGTFQERQVSTSSYGLRGPERPPDKAPGTFRIAGLGDSFMFGWGVADGETYVELLERRLNAAAGPGRRFEVLNFAVPGYNTALEVATFEHRALRFEPDLVLVHFIGNDLALPHFLRPPRGVSPGRWYLADLVRALSRRDEPEPSEDLLQRYFSAPDELHDELRDFDYMHGEIGFRSAMQRLGALTRERDIPVLFMFLAGDNPRFEMPREVARAQGFHVLDVLPHFHDYMVRNGLELTKEVWRETFYIPDDGHPTPLAHRVYADALFDELAAMGVVRPSRRPA